MGPLGFVSATGLRAYLAAARAAGVVIGRVINGLPS